LCPELSRPNGHSTGCSDIEKLKSKLQQNVMLWLRTAGYGYVYYNIMVPGMNVLTIQRDSFTKYFWGEAKKLDLSHELYYQDSSESLLVV
jgi:hypothetical protein